MTLRIDIDHGELARIARAHRVARLRIFGSAISAKFDPERSDVDLLVDFLPGIEDAFSTYFGLKEDLERLFARNVDLIETDSIRDPYFRSLILPVAEDVYAA